MAGANQLLPGFNHNVTRQGRQYHVQTEDSGTANPHVITHLFLGGNVLASKKTSYADLLADGLDLAARVRQIMEAQHKEMLRQLVRGAFDASAGARSFQQGEIHVAQGEIHVAASDRPGPAAEARPAATAPVATNAAPPSAWRPPRVFAAPELPAPAARPVDGWGPPVLPRVKRPPPVLGLGAAPPPPPEPEHEPANRRFDELILSYLAGDLGSKRDGR